MPMLATRRPSRPRARAVEHAVAVALRPPGPLPAWKVLGLGTPRGLRKCPSNATVQPNVPRAVVLSRIGAARRLFTAWRRQLRLPLRRLHAAGPDQSACQYVSNLRHRLTVDLTLQADGSWGYPRLRPSRPDDDAAALKLPAGHHAGQVYNPQGLYTRARGDQRQGVLLMSPTHHVYQLHPTAGSTGLFNQSSAFAYTTTGLNPRRHRCRWSPAPSCVDLFRNQRHWCRPSTYAGRFLSFPMNTASTVARGRRRRPSDKQRPAPARP